MDGQNFQNENPENAGFNNEFSNNYQDNTGQMNNPKQPDYTGQPGYAGQPDYTGQPNYTGQSDYAGQPNYAPGAPGAPGGENIYNQMYYNQTSYNQQNSTPTSSIVGLVLGILSLVCCCGFGTGLLFGVPGLICSIMGNKTDKTGVGTGGLVTSIIGIALNAVCIIFWFVCIIISYYEYA